jgi:hypothetical protein
MCNQFNMLPKEKKKKFEWMKLMPTYWIDKLIENVNYRSTLRKEYNRGYADAIKDVNKRLDKLIDHVSHGGNDMYIHELREYFR